MMQDDSDLFQDAPGEDGSEMETIGSSEIGGEEDTKFQDKEIHNLFDELKSKYSRVFNDDVDSSSILEELEKQGGPQTKDEIASHNLRKIFDHEFEEMAVTSMMRKTKKIDAQLQQMLKGFAKKRFKEINMQEFLNLENEEDVYEQLNSLLAPRMDETEEVVNFIKDSTGQVSARVDSLIGMYMEQIGESSFSYHAETKINRDMKEDPDFKEKYMAKFDASGRPIEEYPTSGTEYLEAYKDVPEEEDFDLEKEYKNSFADEEEEIARVNNKSDQKNLYRDAERKAAKERESRDRQRARLQAKISNQNLDESEDLSSEDIDGHEERSKYDDVDFDEDIAPLKDGEDLVDNVDDDNYFDLSDSEDGSDPEDSALKSGSDSEWDKSDQSDQSDPDQNNLEKMLDLNEELIQDGIGQRKRTELSDEALTDPQKRKKELREIRKEKELAQRSMKDLEKQEKKMSEVKQEGLFVAHDGRLYAHGFPVPSQFYKHFIKQDDPTSKRSLRRELKEAMEQERVKKLIDQRKKRKIVFKADKGLQEEDDVFWSKTSTRDTPNLTTRQLRVSANLFNLSEEILHSDTNQVISDLRERGVTFERVLISRSMRVAKIYYRVSREYKKLPEGMTQDEALTAKKAISDAAKYFRHRLTQEAQMKYSPELHFIFLDSTEIQQSMKASDSEPDDEEIRRIHDTFFQKADDPRH
eukprot:TRINITY_DN7900_c0_g1_i1.p1 TRINITY_DN7900_c0_g1~~TRINITY_DN7900_c0_g1_i1.p1  ORF type:complete len:784 (-),score=337.53 TRINITY_DN7900_c0_g1_i1:50-2137(-)